MKLRHALILLLIILASAAVSQTTGPQLTLAPTDTIPQIGLLGTESVAPDEQPVWVISEVRPVRHVRPVRPQTGPVEAVPVKEEPVVRKSNRPDKVAMLADYEKKQQSPPKQASITATTILSTILKLAVVLALAYLTILVLKWLSVKKDVPSQNQGDFRVKETVRLSPTGTLHLVGVNGKTLLIGCSSGQVNLIREFDETSEVAGESDGRFAEYLERYSETSRKHSAAGRVAGLLHDCTTYLRERRHNVSGGER